jgi:hypothetical protein
MGFHRGAGLEAGYVDSRDGTPVRLVRLMGEPGPAAEQARLLGRVGLLGSGSAGEPRTGSSVGSLVVSSSGSSMPPNDGRSWKGRTGRDSQGKEAATRARAPGRAPAACGLQHAPERSVHDLVTKRASRPIWQHDPGNGPGASPRNRRHTRPAVTGSAPLWPDRRAKEAYTPTCPPNATGSCRLAD